MVVLVWSSCQGMTYVFHVREEETIVNVVFLELVGVMGMMKVTSAAEKTQAEVEVGLESQSGQIDKLPEITGIRPVELKSLNALDEQHY